jgi:P-type Ca2+ transporter type 2C
MHTLVRRRLITESNRSTACRGQTHREVRSPRNFDMYDESPSPVEENPYRQTVDDVLAAFGTDGRSGLSQSQAEERLKCYGRNELAAEARVSEWRKFFTQFTDVLVIVLIIAGSVSAGVWLYGRESALPYEAMAILAIVVLNALMGYFQQARAERALAALRLMSAPHAKVIWDGIRRI